MDTAGNCFIRNDKGIFWHVVGQSNSEDSKVTKHRAFQKNGIKLIYALLLNEALLNEPYRVMAEAANIAASTVGDILTDLQAAKFLVQINDREMKLVNKPELLSQWVTAFNQKLRPKLLRGKFRLPFPSNQIQYFKLREGDYWGGEPAADLLTNYLYPGNWTLFSEKDRKSLITDYRLIPDPKNGNIEVYSPFWKGTDERFVIKERQVVSPLLVYAELIGSGNDRNFETARKIYVQYLQDIIE